MLLMDAPLWITADQTVLETLVAMQKTSKAVACCRAGEQLFWITQEQILAAAATGVPLGSIPVQHIWTEPPLVIPEIGDPEVVLAEMEAAGVDWAPVLEGEEVVGVVCRSRLQKHCLEQVRRSCQIYQEILDRSPEIIERFDVNFRHLYVNAQMEQVTGILKAEFRDKLCRELPIDEQVVAQWEQAARTLLATGIKQEIEFYTPTTQGMRWYAMLMVPERDLEGNICGILCYGRDISDRKRTEIFTQKLIDLIPDLLIHMDRQGNFLEFHSCGSQMRVLHPELLGQPGASVHLIHSPEIAQLWLTHIGQALDHQQLQTFEQRITIDGQVQYEEVRLIPFDQDSVIAVVRDITPYRLAQQSLAESETRFRHLIANVPGAVFQYVQHRNGSNRVTYMSPGCLKLWEVPAAAVEQDSTMLWSLVHPEDLPAMMDSVMRSAEQLTPWEWIWRITTPSGTLKWLHGFGQPRRLNCEETLWDTLIVDVTAEMQTQLALEASQNQLKSILNAVNGVIKRFYLYPNLNWHYDYISPSAERVFGYTPSELFRDPQIWSARIPEDDRQNIIHPTLLTLQQQSSVEIEFRFQHKNQQWLWIQASYTSEWDPEQQAWQVTCLELDITERKLAEERLREQQIQLDLVVQTSNIGFYIFDLRSQTSYVSPAYKAQLGYAPGDPEAGVEDWEQRLHPQDRQGAMEAFRRFREQGQPYSQDFRLRHRDGSYRWIHSDATLVRDSQGRPVKIIGTHLDITDRKQAELLLQQRLGRIQLLNQLLQSIQAAVSLEQIFDLVTQGMGSLLAVDQVIISQYHGQAEVWACLAEYRRHDQVESQLGLRIRVNFIADRLRDGQTVVVDAAQELDAVNEQLRQQFPSAWLIVPIRSQNRTWGAITLRQRDPEWRWQLEWIELAQQVAGHVSLALQQVQLIEQLRYQVEVRNAELQQLLKSEQISRQITEEIRSGLQEQEILQTMVNRLAETLDLYGCLIALQVSEEQYYFSYQSDNFPVPVTGREWYINPDAVQRILNGETLYFSTNHPLWGPSTDLVTAIRDNQECLGFLRLLRPRGSYFSPAEMALAQQVANQCAIAIRQARLFRKIEQQVAELEKLNQVKDDFLHMVSHELRTPLSNMRIALQMLDLNPDPQAQQRYRQILWAEWQREMNLVNELLELQALESGSRQLHLDRLVVPEWLQSILPAFELRCQEREQTLTTTINLEQPVITTDPGLLERIVLELLNNACKYTPPRENISLEVSSSQDQIQFRVSNTGVTIPPDQLDKIFEKFHRISSLDRYQQGGTGLGLALAQKAIAMLGGQIHVASADNQTTFRVILPCQALAPHADSSKACSR
ncbi:MAG: PAS domain-containing protein [Thermostichales cyanobacterium HHBFW_bins_127]